MIGWLYLLTASLLEVGWTFSLKFLDVKKLAAIRWLSFSFGRQDVFAVTPLLGYILFGIGNIFFFSMALKQIPASTAFGIWMATSLIGIKLVDVSLLKEPYNAFQIFYFMLILIGIIGLKRTS